MMVTALRRLFWMGLLGGAGYVGWQAWQRRRDDGEPIPEWPPFDPPSSEQIASNVPTSEPAPQPTTDGPAPDDDSVEGPVADAIGDPPRSMAPPTGPALDHEPNPEARESSPSDDRTTLAAAMATPAAAQPLRWVDPVEDECPVGYPIKANDNSGIYHEPGGRFYDRTVPERCYADISAAEADGYRAAKS